MPKIKVNDQTVRTGEGPQTNGRTHTHTRTPPNVLFFPACYTVDNDATDAEGYSRTF